MTDAGRVVVNRIWQGYFGRGLVATPNDLGYAGARPTHPELLDWLATELVRNGWSLKHIHTLIATSATYRQASADDPARRAVDPENLLLWRRAAALAARRRRGLGDLAGDLRGPPRRRRRAVAGLVRRPGRQGRRPERLPGPEAVDGRPLAHPFDLPDTTTSCARRSATTVAPQALTLFNNPDAVRLARAFSDRVASTPGDPIDAAFRLAPSRLPDADERAMAADLLARHAADYARTLDAPAAARRALADLCRALMNVNEFLFLD